MKLIQPPGTDTWHVQVTTEDRGVRTLDTGCQDHAEAKALVRAAKVSELEAASKAHRLTAEVVTLITANRRLTVTEAIAEWDTWMRSAARSERTRTNNIMVVSQWVRELALGERAVGGLTLEDIQCWINDPASPLKRGARLVRLAGIRAFFRFCVAKRYILHDPSVLAAVDHRLLTQRQRETRHKPVFTDPEIDFLLSQCARAEPTSLTPGFLHAAIVLGRDLALRLGDVCSLEWASFDFARYVATVWTDKTNARVEIPLTRRVVRLVTGLPASDPKYMFPRERDMVRDPSRRAHLSVIFGRFFERCGFPGYSFHCLRASYATTMASQGATLEEIAERLGHSSERTTRVYVRPAACT